MNNTDSFFSKADNEAITAAIREVEATSSGEVAVMVVDRSDTYPEARLLAGITGGVTLALAVTDLLLGASLAAFLPLALVVTLVAIWLTPRLPTLHRLFIPRGRGEEQVRRRALAAFYDKGLHRTREETGVLFFLSLFERRVWVLADRGILSKITPESLPGLAREVSQGIRQGRAAAALCDQIRAVGRDLTRHFPIRPDDINELSDEVIHERF